MSSFDFPLTIENTHKVLREKKSSVLELTKAYLERIKTYDKKINSFITVADDIAQDRARKADELIGAHGDGAFELYPLLGVTIAHKDMYLTKGIRTTAGSSVLEDYIPVYSSTVVERLDKAGAIVVGKTNQDAWAHGSSGENSDFGTTKNPWDTSFVPGGSSSGSAAAIAANFALISTGTDTCGSIRLPASYCYSVGLKPTYGAVSRYGVIAMASSVDTMGHITRSCDDSERVFKVMSGPDGKDATVKEFKYKSNKKDKITIGVPKEFFQEGLDKEVNAKLQEAISKFSEHGFEIKNVSLPHTKYGIDVYYIIQPAEVSSNLGRYDGIRYGNVRTVFSEEAKRRIMLGTYVLSAGYYDAYYLKAMKVRTIIKKEVEEVFKDVDCLIAPVAPTPPFKLGEKVDDPLQMYLTDIYAATANLSGIPALALPFGFNSKGLPMGFQLMGPKFSEPLLFEMGKRFETFSNYQPAVANMK